MKRLCVIDMMGVSPRLLGAVDGLWVNTLPGSPRPLRAVFPNVFPSVQTTLTTGQSPGKHGIVSGGVFRRQARGLSFEEQSNTLVSKKRFWHARALPQRPTVALLLWSFPLAGASDFVVGAAGYTQLPHAVYDRPLMIYRELKAEVGPLDTSLLHGRRASHKACDWVAQASEWMWRESGCELMCVSLPGVDFALTRHGPEAEETREALRHADASARWIAESLGSDASLAVLSSGGLIPVRKAGRPNLALRRAGLLEAGEDGRIDLKRSRAFVLTDHQVGHLYCLDPGVVGDAADALRAIEGVADVRSRDELFERGLGHDRAGECILLAEKDAWLCPEAMEGFHPDLSMDKRGGYDPRRLTGSAEIESVRASRGRVDVSVDDQCFLASNRDALPENPEAVEVAEVFRRLMFEV